MSSTVLICGLGRCGTTVLMSVLASGGFPVFGSPPAYEEVPYAANMEKFLPSIKSKAAKIIDPHRCRWPSPITAKIIWLRRDFEQQARSQIKFARLVGGIMFDPPIKKIADSLRSETERSLRVLSGCEILQLNFEMILFDPMAACDQIADFVGDPFNPEMGSMAIIRRSPRCAKGLDIEMEAINAGNQIQ